MLGIPPWTPFNIMKEEVAARSRLPEEMDALYRRVNQYQRGAAVDFNADMSDISNTALERNRVYILSVWDIKPAGGTWKVPVMIPGTGVKQPVKDIRVVISHRIEE